MAGLQDLLHVVVAEAGTRRPGGDDDGVLVREDEESDGDDESEVEEEVDASDEDGGDSSGDDEPAKATPAVAAGSKRKADEDADSDETSSDSSGDEDTEEYDDEAMFRMDDKIVAYLKAAAAAKAEPQEAAAALVALKFRALSLLEVFARKVPSSPLLLAAGLPLLRGLVAACRPQAPAGAPSGNPLLAERLGSVLVKTVCKAKPTYSAAILPPAAPATVTPPATASQGAEEPGTASGPEVTLDSVMRKVCHLAARAEDKRVAAAAVAVLGMQLCCCSAPQAPEPVKELCNSSLVWLVHDWCHHKACRLSLVAMKQLWARAGNAASSGLVMAALLKEAAGAARNAFTQVQAMELLAAHLRHVVSQPRTPATSLTYAHTDTPAAAKPASSVQGKAAATVAATAAAAAAEGEQAAHPLLLVLKPHAKSLGSVLAAAAGGAGMKAEHHLDALRAAVQVVEAVRKVCTEAGKKLAVLVGAEWLNAVAKAVVTVRELGVSDRVNTQLSRLIQVMGIAELVAVAQPDPALKMRLAKAQAARAEAASKPKNSVTHERAAKHVASKARSASAAAAKGGAAASSQTKKQKAPASSPGRTGKHAERVLDAQSGGAAPAAKLSKHAHKAARAQQEAQDVGVNGGSAVKSKKAKVAKS